MKFLSRVRLCLVDIPFLFFTAPRNSGRSPWLSILSGLLSESPMTFPEGNIIVILVEVVSPICLHSVSISCGSSESIRSCTLFWKNLALISRSFSVCVRKNFLEDIDAYQVTVRIDNRIMNR